MKTKIFTMVGMLIATTGFATGTIVLEGTYQGKNLYVQNPFGASGVGFCVQEVKVNGVVTTDEVASSAFEIDFKNLQLKLGDKIEVRITHKDECKPKVLNPEVLKPRSNFDIVSIKIDKEFVLRWTTTSETGKLDYVVEQFRWNKWVKVGTVEGVGTSEANNYEFKITPHSGVNQVRVKQVDYTGQPRYSKTVDFDANFKEITYSPTKVTNDINFYEGKKPAETMYEIYDKYGNIVKRGYAKNVDVANLERGPYYLNYDNKMGEFVKK